MFVSVDSSHYCIANMYVDIFGILDVMSFISCTMIISAYVVYTRCAGSS